MKNLPKLFKPAVLCCLTILLQVSCSKDDDGDTEVLTSEQRAELQLNQQLDVFEANLSSLVIGVYQLNESQEFGRMAGPTNTIPTCATFTMVMEQNYRKLTLDFGEGCELNDNTYAGKLIIDYTRDPQAQKVQINYKLEDFFYNQLGMAGDLSILFTRANSNGNPEFANNLNLNVVWPDGKEATRSGQKIMEQIEGANTTEITDNVFMVTGYWISTFRNGVSHSYEVLEALRREVGCPYFVSGTLDVERTNLSGVLDFGTGACDDMANFTLDSGETVALRFN